MINQLPNEPIKVASVFGVSEMIAITGDISLHSDTKGIVEDFGELCDSDCIDCD